MKVAVLFPKIFDHPFTYKSEISQKLKPGDFVKAPFGSSEITGVIWPKAQITNKKFKIKKISNKIDVKNLNHTMIEFIKWFSRYNLVPLGMSLKMCLLNKDVVEKSFEKEFKEFKIIKKIAKSRKLKIITIGKKSSYIKILSNKYKQEKQLLKIYSDSKIINLEIRKYKFEQICIGRIENRN